MQEMDNKIKSSSKIGNILDPFLFDFEILNFENKKTNLRLGDILYLYSCDFIATFWAWRKCLG